MFKKIIDMNIFFRKFYNISQYIICGVFDIMIKIDKRMIIIITIGLVFCASFQPIIAGINIKIHQQSLTPVEDNSALLVAENKLKEMKKATYQITNQNKILDEKGSVLCYVFNLDPIGYIVITGYKILPPVLAYSFTSTFFEQGMLLYDLVKADITLRLTHHLEIKESVIDENIALWNSYLDYEGIAIQNKDSQWPKEGAKSTGGWIETKWDQNSPYNDFCPMDLTTSKRSLAGCPSVAMAQILNYHQTTKNVQFNDSDDYYHNWVNYYWIDDDFETYDFPSYPQLNTYIDTLTLHYMNEVTLTDEDKAALTFACGVACKQVYTSNVSGTFGVDQAYDAYKRFYFNECELLTSDEPNTYEIIQDNIIKGFPVHLAVVNEAWNVGHNLVIDGYKEDGFYHLNFGWGGPYDGWYKIPEELPFDLTVLEGVVVNIIDINSESNLQSEGVLYWPDTNPGTTVEGSFTIENVGDSGSNIDWEVATWPEWGEWSINPSSGVGLTPETGKITINVSVISPEKKGKSYNGYIKIVDIDNSLNSCLVHIHLTTPRTKLFTNQFLFQIFENFPNLFPFLRYLRNN
jgi:hypothetical protein